MQLHTCMYIPHIYHSCCGYNYVCASGHSSYCVCSGYAVAQWLGLHLQLLGVAMVAGVSFLAVLEHHFSSVDPGTFILLFQSFSMLLFLPLKHVCLKEI